MPEDFDRCVADGGKVITKTLDGGKYIHLCKDGAGHWHKGEMKHKQAKAEGGTVAPGRPRTRLGQVNAR